MSPLTAAPNLACQDSKGLLFKGANNGPIGLELVAAFPLSGVDPSAQINEPDCANHHAAAEGFWSRKSGSESKPAISMAKSRLAKPGLNKGAA